MIVDGVHDGLAIVGVGKTEHVADFVYGYGQKIEAGLTHSGGSPKALVVVEVNDLVRRRLARVGQLPAPPIERVSTVEMTHCMTSHTLM